MTKEKDRCLFDIAKIIERADGLEAERDAQRELMREAAEVLNECHDMIGFDPNRPILSIINDLIKRLEECDEWE